VNLKNILLSCVSCVVLTGCYTQLAMFYPEPEIEEHFLQIEVTVHLEQIYTLQEVTT
jgi:hypothetical protein